MGMSASPKGRAKLRASGKKPAPMKVGAEFAKADTGKVKKLPKRVPIKLARVKGAKDTDNSW